MKVLSSYLISEKNKLASASPFLWLIKIEIYVGGVLQTTWKCTDAGEDITFDSQLYQAWPCLVTLPSESGSGELQECLLALANADRTIQAYLDTYGGMVGSKVTLTLVHRDHLTDIPSQLSTKFEVLQSGASSDVAQLTLGSPADLRDQIFPGRRVLPDYCQWRYKEDGCYNGGSKPAGFLHDDEACDKTLAGALGCLYHVNTRRFGAFPGVTTGYK